jgi:predicted phosphoribosyltransferase
MLAVRTWSCSPFARIVVAVPVSSAAASNELRPEVEELICLAEPEPFYAVGAWYRDFSQVSDTEVHDLLDRSALDLAELSAVSRPTWRPSFWCWEF